MTAVAALHNMIVPSRIRLDKSTDITFVCESGTSPFVWSLGVGSVGSIDPSTGIFSSGSTAGPVHVIATDANSVEASVDCYVADPVSISPESISLQSGQSGQFFGSDGVPPLKFSTSLPTSDGSLDPDTGVVTIDSNYDSQSIAVVSVTDDYGNVDSSATVAYIGPVSIQPNSGEIEVNSTFQFQTDGLGTQPYTWTVPTGPGSIDSNGLYTSPSTGIGATVIVRVTDSAGAHSDATMELISDLNLQPNHQPEAVLKSTTRQFVGSGGTAPYAYSKESGGGSIDSGGLYTAPASPDTAIVRVTDSFSPAQHIDADVKVTDFLDTSCSFDGVDDYLDCGDILDLGKDDAFSVSGWVYVSEEAISAGSTFPFIGRTVIDGSGGGWNGWTLYGLLGWQFELIQDNATSDGLKVFFDPDGIVGNQWVHLTLTYDGSGLAAGVQFYANGVLVEAQPQQDSLSGSAKVSSHAEMGRLVYQAPSNGYYGLGNLCNVAAFSGVLDSSDVAALYNSGSPADVSAHAKYSDCLGYWKLGQGDTFPNLADAKASNTAVMTNMVAGNIEVGLAP